MKTKSIAIVTGASAGLGMEFARQIDLGFELDEIWLVARRMEPMERFCDAMKRAKGIPIKADLASKEGVEIVTRMLDEQKPDVKILVNNAGFGMFGRFQKLDSERQLSMLDLNIGALTKLTHHGLGFMDKGAIIVQVASVLGFMPAPGWAVYGATKAYVVSFSSALNRELSPRGINCVACCPGPMKTEFFDVADNSEEMGFYLDPKKVVASALRHGKRGEYTSVEGLFMKISELFSRLFSRRFITYMMARQFSKD